MPSDPALKTAAISWGSTPTSRNLTAIAAEILQERGAYATGGEASDVSGMYKTLYRCPNVSTRATSVSINTGPAVAFRAPGHVEAAFALEQAMDELAIALVKGAHAPCLHLLTPDLELRSVRRGDGREPTGLRWPRR